VRGEGLLIGLKAVVPSGDLVTALPRSKAAHVAAGEKRGAVPAAADRNRAESRSRRAPRARLRDAFRRSIEAAAGAMSKAMRHFLDLSELPTKECRSMLAAGVAIRRSEGTCEAGEPLEARPGDDFRKTSTRTRVSFDVGMRQLGGESIMLTGAECSRPR